MQYVWIGLANVLVGISIGISGIAGFLLPIFYTGALLLPVADSMSMSFGAFGIAGLVGTYAYHKTKDIDFSFCKKMMFGSILGSLIGVWLHNLVPVMLAKQVLYTMVLLSGITLFFPRKDGTNNPMGIYIKTHPLIIAFLGLCVAMISAFTGAGGPILSVPLLLLLGFSVRQAVGMSLFNSIFIAVPAFFGYAQSLVLDNSTALIVVALLFHGVGIAWGTRISSKINQKILKIIIAIIAILVSIYMLAQTL